MKSMASKSIKSCARLCGYTGRCIFLSIFVVSVVAITREARASLIIASDVGALATATCTGSNCPGALTNTMITIPTGVSAPTAFNMTVSVDEDNATELGSADIPLTFTTSQGIRYTWSVMSGSVVLPGGGGVADDSLLFQAGAGNIVRDIHVTSDVNEGGPAEVDTYTVVNTETPPGAPGPIQFTVIYEIHSASEIPEPGTVILLGVGVTVLYGRQYLLGRWLRRK